MLSFIVIYYCVVKPRKKRFMIIKESSKIPEDASLKGKIILEFSLPILERNPFDRQSLREDKDGLKQFLSLFRFGVVERFFSTQNWPRVEYGKMSNLFNVALNAQTLIMKNHSENVEFRRTFFSNPSSPDSSTNTDSSFFSMGKMKGETISRRVDGPFGPTAIIRKPN